jgi:outer membrane protein, multidrug efflux system
VLRPGRRWINARNIAIVLCLGLTSGCTQGPDYQKPVIQIPPAYRFESSGFTSATTTDSAEWWNEFGDPILNGMIRESVANNRDLTIATARVDEFDAILRGTQSQAFPQIGYDVSASRKRTSERIGIPFPPGSSPLGSTFGALLTSSWEIDLWGRIRRETEAARANLLATTEARRGVVLTLVASVITGYVTLLDLDDRLQVAKDTLAGRGESVVIFRKRLDGGYISDYEMALVQAEYDSAAAAVPDLERLVSVQESALSVLLGRNPGPIERGRNLRSLGKPAVPPSLPAELLTRRPDILAAEQQLIASNALIGAARALYFPQIFLTGIGGLASKSLGNLFTGTARTWTFTGDVAGPIYTGGGLRAATDQAVARREQSLAAYELAIQTAFREVEDALITVQKAREIEQSVDRRVTSLKQAVALVRIRYDNGYSDYLDVLDTERSLFSAELALAEARGNNYRALADLYRALGGDWVDQADSMATEERGSKAATAQPR